MKRVKAKKVTLESLAGVVAGGFDEQGKKFAELKGEMSGLESRLSQQITGINNRLDDLALNRATREELLVLDKRVGRIETKLGLDFKHSAHV